MWHSLRPTIVPRIIHLEEQCLIWRHLGGIVPLVFRWVRGRLDCPQIRVWSSDLILVNIRVILLLFGELLGFHPLDSLLGKLVISDAVRIGHAEGVSLDGLPWSPEVDQCPTTPRIDSQLLEIISLAIDYESIVELLRALIGIVAVDVALRSVRTQAIAISSYL